MAGFNMMALMNTASQSEAAKPPYETRTLPIAAIIPNPANHYSMSGIDELADSILIAGRVLQNIVVKAADADGRYMIISGHRRHLACQKLVADGHTEFANIAALVENEANENMRELMLIYTNSTARQLTDAEKMRQAQRATDILKQVKAEGKMDAPIRETVARMLNTTSGQLARYAAIANNLTNPDLKEAFEQEKIGVSAAYESAGLSHGGQKKVAEKLKENGGVSIRDVVAIKESEKKSKEEALSENKSEPVQKAEERTVCSVTQPEASDASIPKTRRMKLAIKRKFKIEVTLIIIEENGCFYAGSTGDYPLGGWSNSPTTRYTLAYKTQNEAIDAEVKRVAQRDKKIHKALWESGYHIVGDPDENRTDADMREEWENPCDIDEPHAERDVRCTAQSEEKQISEIRQRPEVYAVQTIYNELKNLEESYQGAAQRAASIVNNAQSTANLTAAAEYARKLMGIVEQEMADIEAEEGTT